MGLTERYHCYTTGIVGLDELVQHKIKGTYVGDVEFITADQRDQVGGVLTSAGDGRDFGQLPLRVHSERPELAVAILESGVEDARVFWVRCDPRGALADVVLSQDIKRRWADDEIQRGDEGGVGADKDGELGHGCLDFCLMNTLRQKSPCLNVEETGR